MFLARTFTLAFICLIQCLAASSSTAPLSEWAYEERPLAEFFPKVPIQRDLSVCAIFQSEDRFLKEWIEFHLLVGVEHFYLYNNLSDDRYKEVLKPYIEKGIVDLIEWEFESANVVDWNVIQCNAYMHAIKKARGVSRWVAVIDTDEFLVPISENNLVKILSKYVKFGGVCANWVMYGTSSVSKVPEDKLMTELLLMRAPEDFGPNIHVKTIAQPLRVLDCRNPHHFIFKKGYFSVNTKQEDCPGPFNEPPIFDTIRVHHYWVRDEDFLHAAKIPRNEKWGGNKDKILEQVQQMNQVYDPLMLKFSHKLRARMGL